MKFASSGVGVMLGVMFGGMLAASACGDSASSGGTTPSGGSAGAGGATGGSAGSGGATGGATSGSSGSGATAGSGAGSGNGGGAGSGGTAGGGAGMGGTAGNGGAANGGSAGLTAGNAGEEGDAGGESGGSAGTGGSAGMGGTAGSGGASAGTGGMAGTAGAPDECDLSTRTLLGTCERPVTSGGAWSCTEFYDATAMELQFIEFECEDSNGIFSDSPCPEMSFGEDRVGCCVAPDAVNRSCYYGQGSLEGITPLCESLGCMIEPG